jgi:hypothetical protein
MLLGQNIRRIGGEVRDMKRHSLGLRGLPEFYDYVTAGSLEITVSVSGYGTVGVNLCISRNVTIVRLWRI